MSRRPSRPARCSATSPELIAAPARGPLRAGRVWPEYVIVLLACWLVAAPALAQVSTDDRALDQLAPAPAAHAPAPPPAPRVRHGPTHLRAAAPAARLKTPAMPTVAPAYPVIAPPAFVMPAHPPAPPPPVPVRADAPGVVAAIKGGTRITFGPGIADLNPATLAAVQAIGAKALASPLAIVSVTGWAPGTADDPSTARRLSLDRALAARAVLIRGGMVSDRIRTVAKGTGDVGDAPADRVDVVVGQ